MGLNKNDWRQIESEAKKNGYRWNQAGTSMNDGKNTIKSSKTGQSGTVNGKFFNTTHEAKKYM